MLSADRADLGVAVSNSSGESRDAEMRDGRGDEWLPGWLPAAAIAIYGVCAVAFWAEPDWRPEWDSALYFLTARSLAEGGGYRYLGEAFFLRPPGLSWFLSLFPLGVGGDPAFALLNRVFMLSATAVVAAVYVAFRRDYGRGWALVIALLTGTSPIFVDRLNFILTDLPFLALLFLALTSLDRGLRGGRGRWMPTVTGALLLVLAIHLRTVAIVVLPVLVFLYLHRRGDRKWAATLLPVALVTALMAPWFSYVRTAARVAQRPAEQLYLFDYTTALLHVDPGDPNSPLIAPSEWIERIIHNGTDLLGGLTSGVFGTEHPAFILLFIALAATGAWVVVRRGATLIDWFALAYGVVLLTYFTHAPRLLLPLLPLAYAYLASAIALLSSQASRRGKLVSGSARALAIVVVRAALLHNAILLPERLDVRSQRTPLAERWEDMKATSDWLKQNTPEDAVVLAVTAPIISLLSHRVVYTGRYTRDSNLFDRNGIEYAIAFHWTPNPARRIMNARSVAVWELASVTPGKRTHIYRIESRTKLEAAEGR